VKYAAEMGSGAMIYIPSFVKIDSGIQKLMWGGGDTQTHTQKNKKSRLKMISLSSLQLIID
jgi:hypothetical protein